MRLFKSSVSSHDTGNGAAPELRQHQVIAAILGASPIPLTELANDGGFDAAAAQAYLGGGIGGGDVELVASLRKAAAIDEYGVPRGPYFFTPATPGQANEIWQLTYDGATPESFAFEVVAGGSRDTLRRDHHIFAYRDRGGHTSFLYVPRHGDVDIWHETQEVAPDNFDLLHSMLSDLTENHPGGHQDLLHVLHDWLRSARDVWRSYQEAMQLTAHRSTATSA